MTGGWTRVTGGMIAITGSALAVFLLVDVAMTTGTPGTLYRVVQTYPVVLALVLTGAGVLLARGRLIDDRYLGRLLLWVVVGVAALASLAVYLVSLIVAIAGYELRGTPVGLITILTTGALVGVIVGVYDVRNRERKDEVDQLNRVNDTLRIATGELVEQSDRAALERAICRRLAESDAYGGAWVARYDPDDDRVHPVPVAWAGLEDAVVQTLAAAADGGVTDRTVYDRAVETREVQFVPVPDGEPARGGGTRRTPEPMAVVPIVGADSVHGLLGVYAGERTALDVGENVFAELGETVGLAIDSIRTRTGLARRERELVAQNERLDRFASVVSHDLRNPLGVVLGRVDLARGGDSVADLDVIERAAERMEEIIEDLLALSRAGRTVADREPVGLAAAARYSWENVETDGVEFDLRVPEETMVAADRARLLNVFENLIRNAVEHGSTGPASSPRQNTVEDDERPLTVGVGVLTGATSSGGDSVIGFYVEDDGPGIPPEEHESVFDHGYTTNEEGTGFGLAIVKEIVEAHGWAVSVTAREGGGTRFEIWTDRYASV